MEKKKSGNKFRITTFQIIVTGFAGLIVIGALLLMLPFSSSEPGCAPFSDCLFTATSAVCVTGLVVRDTATGWTPFGQAVILALIQTGGMGVVTMAVVLSFLSGKKIGLMERSVMQESISAPQVGGIVRLTRFIVGTSLCIEGLGAAALLPVMIPRFGLGRGIWYALFHSVSAFCNAGFDLMGSSLTDFSQDILVNVVIMVLITVGGIGFLVWNDIREQKFSFRHYRLQTKIVLVTSVVLVLLPALWIQLFELPELSAGRRLLPALFQSVTLRTAGFNTVDLNLFSDSGQAMMIIWMLIGGSPGSTAGGMKTTTLAVLLLTAWSVFRRKGQIACFGRRIADEAVHNTLAILVMYVCLFSVGAVVISHVERLPLVTCMFETASAVGTVGVTLGITSHLGLISRIVLMVLMFLGRVGGLTLIYAAQPVRASVNRTYPMEKVTVG